MQIGWNTGLTNIYKKIKNGIQKQKKTVIWKGRLLQGFLGVTVGNFCYPMKPL